MIPARNRTNLVLVQSKTAVQGQWNDTVSWTEFRQVWVSIAPNRGREVFKGDELESVVTHTIRGDYLELEGISPEMRLVYNDTHEYAPIRADSQVFDVLAVMPEADHHADCMIQASAKQLRYGDLSPDIPE